MSTYTIGQVAERTGFPASTLRFYEAQGLLEPAGRTPAGYRYYHDGSLARLRFIARAKDLGCSLEEIADVIGLWEADACGPVQARLHRSVVARRAEATRRAGELRALADHLGAAAQRLAGRPLAGPCTDRCACLDEGPNGSGPSSGPGSASTPRGAASVEPGPGTPFDPACTLPAAEVPDRLTAWRAALVDVADRESTADGGLRLVLGPTTPVEEVARLAVAEHDCCGFFRFALTADERGVALEVRAPAEAADVVTAVFGSPAGPGGA